MADGRYGLLVVDIDGTLLDREGIISEENKTAIARVIDSGIRVSLSTGRVVQACLKILDQLALDGYHIFFDGALVSNPKTGEEVYVEPIDRQLVQEIVEFIHHHEINLDFYSIAEYFIERENWATEIRRRFFGLQPTISDFSKLWPEERIIKGTLPVFSGEEREKAESFRQHFGDRLSLSVTETPAYPGVNFINVIAKGVSKGRALRALASYLEIPLDGVVAIGDGANDVSLLEEAGLAVAMGNAHDELKGVADHITLDVDHSGVARAVNMFLLNQ
ncbi:MAG: HAD family phosphatase [Dehalococcoidales bacterium]|nr:MAG: HAD family phosphatase [Dehalococcoidales bacterium]